MTSCLFLRRCLLCSVLSGLLLSAAPPVVSPATAKPPVAKRAKSSRKNVPSPPKSTPAPETETTQSPAAITGQTNFVVPVPAGNLLYDPIARRIYAAVGSKGPGETTNSITVIDPRTGRVGPSVFVGSGPHTMTLSENGKHLFVVVSDGTAVRQVDLPDMKPGPLYAMPGKPVRTLLPAPGQPDGFIAHRGNGQRYDDTLGVYVDGKLVGKEAGCAPTIMRGIAPSRLYSYQSQLSSWDFDGYDAYPDEIFHISHSQSVMSGYIGFSGTLNGLLISDNGGVLDPETGQTLGQLNFDGKKGALLPDPRTGYVYSIAEEKDGQVIAAADVRNLGYVGSQFVPSGVKGGAGTPIRWGEDGFAYTAGDKVVILRMPPGPLPPLNDLTVERSAIPETLPKDNTLTYTLTVTNRGTAPASGVSLSDVLPPETDVLTVKASQGNATAADGKVRAEIGKLAPGAKATVDVSLQFKEMRDVRFNAVVRAYEPDPRPENNIARFEPEDTLSPLPDLTGQWDELKQVSRGAGVRLQSGLTGRFTVRNDGKQEARAVTLRFYVAARPHFDARTSLLLQEVSLPAIRAKKSYTAILEALLEPGDDFTGLTIFAVVDADGALTESNRSNNNVGQRVP